MDNIGFILSYIMENPGCHRREAWKALLIKKGLNPSDRSNRGRFVSYFYTKRNSQAWTIAPDGRLWLTVMD